MYAEFAIDQVSFYEGYLTKKANKFPFKWSKRFIVIWSNGNIEISDGPRSKRNATKIFHCSEIQKIANSDINNPSNQYGFVIKTLKRKWNLAVPTMNDRKIWISQFNQIIHIIVPSDNKSNKANIRKRKSMNDVEINKTERENEEILDPQIVALMDANIAAINNEIATAKQKYNDSLQMYPSWNTLNLSHEFSYFT